MTFQILINGFQTILEKKIFSEIATWNVIPRNRIMQIKEINNKISNSLFIHG